MKKLLLVLTLLLFIFLFINVCDAGLEILEEKVKSGTIINISLQSPTNSPFIEEIRISKSNDSSIANMLGSILIEAEQSLVEPGQQFIVKVDTLNFKPGIYYFYTWVRENFSLYFYDKIEITPRDIAPINSITNDVNGNGRIFALYDEDGRLIADSYNATSNLPNISSAKVYALAVNLKRLKNFRNEIKMDYYKGGVMQKQGLFSIKVIRDRGINEILKNQNNCTGNPIEGDNISIIYFRTPKHLPYYEYDGEFYFNLSASDDLQCNTKSLAIKAHYDDFPAKQPITKNYGTKIDTGNISLVYIGNKRFMNTEEISQFAGSLKDYLSSATKEYFSFNIEKIYNYPLINDNNREKITNWYANAPKTPGKKVLNLNDSDELYLAALLYYAEHSESDFIGDVLKLYPINSNGEYYTVYLFEGGENDAFLGLSMGSASRIMVMRLYPISIFYNDSANGRTYHFDLESCKFCGSNVSQYIEFLKRAFSNDSIISIIIHEIGHSYWMKNSRISTGDLQAKALPFSSDMVYNDESICYFTRFDYMSYCRNRENLTGMAYGDDYLEKLLKAYGRFENRFIRCDANDDKKIDISDSIFIFNYLFTGGKAPRCLKAADSNDDGLVDISDGIYINYYLFGGGKAPPAPFPNAGFDPTPDILSC